MLILLKEMNNLKKQRTKKSPKVFYIVVGSLSSSQVPAASTPATTGTATTPVASPAASPALTPKARKRSVERLGSNGGLKAPWLGWIWLTWCLVLFTFCFQNLPLKTIPLRIDDFCCLKSFVNQHERNQHDLYTEILENSSVVESDFPWYGLDLANHVIISRLISKDSRSNVG